MFTKITKIWKLVDFLVDFRVRGGHLENLKLPKGTKLYAHLDIMIYIPKINNQSRKNFIRVTPTAAGLLGNLPSIDNFIKYVSCRSSIRKTSLKTLAEMPGIPEDLCEFQRIYVNSRGSM